MQCEGNRNRPGTAGVGSQVAAGKSGPVLLMHAARDYGRWARRVLEAEGYLVESIDTPDRLMERLIRFRSQRQVIVCGTGTVVSLVVGFVRDNLIDARVVAAEPAVQEWTRPPDAMLTQPSSARQLLATVAELLSIHAWDPEPASGPAVSEGASTRISRSDAAPLHAGLN